MRSLLNTAAVVTAAIALGRCPNKRPEPVPGPQSAPAQSAPTSDERDDNTRRTASARRHRASEAFSPTTASAGRCFAIERPGAATIAAVGPVAQRLVQGTHRQGAFARKRAKWTG